MGQDKIWVKISIVNSQLIGAEYIEGQKSVMTKFLLHMQYYLFQH